MSVFCPNQHVVVFKLVMTFVTFCPNQHLQSLCSPQEVVLRSDTQILSRHLPPWLIELSTMISSQTQIAVFAIFILDFLFYLLLYSSSGNFKREKLKEATPSRDNVNKLVCFQQRVTPQVHEAAVLQHKLPITFPCHTLFLWFGS